MPISTAGAGSTAAVTPTGGSPDLAPAPSAGVAETPLGPRTSPLPGSTAPTSGVGRSSSSDGPRFETKAFRGNETLRAIMEGTALALRRGGPKSEAVKVAQTALYSFGHLASTSDADGAFGPRTEAAVLAFQASVAGLPKSGRLDAATLTALDARAKARIDELKADAVPAGTKRAQFEIVADIASASKARIYVLDRESGEPVARYLTSPGTSQFPTKGESFRIFEVLPRRAWNPPSSAWAANLQPVPPGIHNPMGILKLSFGMYAEYFHGIPAHEEDDLGHAASHGCCRMSGANILEFHENYCEAGSKVVINRSPERAAELEAAYQASELSDRPKDAGREYMFGYVSGELGAYQKRP